MVLHVNNVILASCSLEYSLGYDLGNFFMSNILTMVVKIKWPCSVCRVSVLPVLILSQIVVVFKNSRNLFWYPLQQRFIHTTPVFFYIYPSFQSDEDATITGLSVVPISWPESYLINSQVFIYLFRRYLKTLWSWSIKDAFPQFYLLIFFSIFHFRLPHLVFLISSASISSVDQLYCRLTLLSLCPSHSVTFYFNSFCITIVILFDFSWRWVNYTVVSFFAFSLHLTAFVVLHLYTNIYKLT